MFPASWLLIFANTFVTYTYITHTFSLVSWLLLTFDPYPSIFLFDLTFRSKLLLLILMKQTLPIEQIASVSIHLSVALFKITCWPISMLLSEVTFRKIYMSCVITKLVESSEQFSIKISRLSFGLNKTIWQRWQLPY